MLTSVLLTALRGAVVALVSQGARNAMSNALKRVWAALQVVLARFPQAAPAAAVVLAGVLARYGFHVSVTTLLGVVSAVEVFLSALASKSAKAVARSK